MEASFSTIDKDKVRIIATKAHYIKRLSFGLQNVNSKFLASNNRDNGSFRHELEIFEECRKYGIKCLNIDLMYGFNNQTDDDFEATLKVVSELNPEHITLYELRTNMLNGYTSLSKERLFKQYEFLYRRITDMGYEGCFGRNTFSKIGDWGLSPYLRQRMTENGSYKGFGIAAQTKNKQGLSYNVGKGGESLKECLNQYSFECGGDIYHLPPEEMAAKYIAICGYCGCFRLSKLAEITTTDYTSVFDFLTKRGLIRIEGDYVSITSKGFRHYGACSEKGKRTCSSLPYGSACCR